jgi:hypothetical protein
MPAQFMRTFGRVVFATTLLALCAVLAGCGGGSDGDEEQSALTKAEYVKQADEICAAAEKRQRKLATKFAGEKKGVNGPRGTEELISFAAIPPLEQAAKELKGLPPSKQEAAKAKAYLAAFEKGIEVASKEPGTILVEPGAFTKAEAIAKEFGFKSCGGA